MCFLTNPLYIIYIKDDLSFCINYQARISVPEDLWSRDWRRKEEIFSRIFPCLPGEISECSLTKIK